MRISGLVCLAAIFLCGCSGSQRHTAAKPVSGGQSEQMLEKQITTNISLRYLLYLPESYSRQKGQKWPLLLFLHGAGERGNDLNLVKKHGPPKLMEQGKEFPFIVVAPQCPSESWWTEELDALAALLDEVQSRYAVDPDRVYLTGLSMGGFGTWTLACRYPERFAAIAPICGGGAWFRAPAQERPRLGFPRGERPRRRPARIDGDGRIAQEGRRGCATDRLPRSPARFLDRELQ
jgi:poly(3-hydroxybutyrate) depolymerase